MCQFTDDRKRSTLADYVDVQNVYPAGRLDYDSEGLVLLTDDGRLQHRIASPQNKMKKTYWVQVEGLIDQEAIHRLCHGIELKDGPTRPALARQLSEPDVWPRTPPIRERANHPTSWLEITLTEGRNRQVRRMTAAVGFPTLRLIRVRIGEWSLGDLLPGQSQKLAIHIPVAAPGNGTGRSARNHQRRHPHSPKHSGRTKTR